MELLQLRYFCTVAQFENITRAAQIHLTSQPAMSKTIMKLEEEVGAKLFERKGNRIQLNDQGRLFYNHIQKALLSINDAVSAVRSDGLSGSSEIRLLILSNREIVLNLVTEFARENPSVSFYLCQDSMENVSYSCHYCISAMPSRSDFNSSLPLLRERVVVALPPGHRLAEREAIAPMELRNEHFVMLSAQYSPDMHMPFMAYCRENGFEPQISIYCSDPAHVRQYVSLGFGISIVPEYSWRNNLSSNVVLRPLENSSLYRTTSVFWNKNSYIPAIAQKFYHALVQRYEEINDSFTQG